jgi:hypothetical protein
MVRLHRADEPRSASDSARPGDPIGPRFDMPLASTPRHVNHDPVTRLAQGPFGGSCSAIHIYLRSPCSLEWPAGAAEIVPRSIAFPRATPGERWHHILQSLRPGGRLDRRQAGSGRQSRGVA